MTTEAVTVAPANPISDEPPYECPCCMLNLKGSARCCPNCGINLPRDWLDARLWMMFGVTELQGRVEYVVVLVCPVCDQRIESDDGVCPDCGFQGTKRFLTEGGEE